MLEITAKYGSEDREMVKRGRIDGKGNSAESIFGMVTTKILISISMPQLIIQFKKEKPISIYYKYMVRIYNFAQAAF